MVNPLFPLLVNELLHVWIVHILSGEKLESRNDLLGYIRAFSEVLVPPLHGELSDFGRLLSEHKVHLPLFERVYQVHGRIPARDLHSAGEPCIHHRLIGTLGAEQVGAEYSNDVRVFLQRGKCLLLGLLLHVQVIVHADDFHVRVFGNSSLEACHSSHDG